MTNDDWVVWTSIFDHISDSNLLISILCQCLSYHYLQYLPHLSPLSVSMRKSFLKTCVQVFQVRSLSQLWRTRRSERQRRQQDRSADTHMLKYDVCVCNMWFVIIFFSFWFCRKQGQSLRLSMLIPVPLLLTANRSRAVVIQRRTRK